MAVYLSDSEAVCYLFFEDVDVGCDRFFRAVGFYMVGFDEIELWAVGGLVLPVVGDNDFVGLTIGHRLSPSVFPGL
jgi:hypothetical protein